MTKILTNTIEVLRKLKESDIAEIQFIKKDGSLRLMKCTLNFKKIPEQHYPKTTKISEIINLIKKNLIRVYDIESKGWRTIPANRTIFIKNDDGEYMVNFNLKKDFLKLPEKIDISKEENK